LIKTLAVLFSGFFLTISISSEGFASQTGVVSEPLAAVWSRLIPAGLAQVVVVGSLSEPAAIQLVSKGKLRALQKLPIDRGLGAVFVVDKRATDQLFTIELKNSYSMNLAIEPKVEVFDLPSDAQHATFILQYSQFLTNWGGDDEISRLEASVALIRTAINELPSSLVLKLYLVEVYLALLKQTENYAELDKFGESFLSRSHVVSSNDELMQHFFVRAELLAVASEREEYGQVIDGYQRIVNELDEVELLENHHLLFREDVRATLGNMLIQYGRQRDDASDVLKKRGYKHISKAIAEARNIGDDRAVANYKNMLWSYYYLIGEAGLAEVTLSESIELHQKVGVSKNLADAYHNSSIFNQMQGNFGSALSQLQKALQIEELYPETPNKADLLYNIANLSLKLGRYDVAHLNAERALRMFESADNEYGKIKSSIVSGRASRAQGEYSAAIKSLLQAIQFLQKNEQADTQNWSDLVLARVELSHNYLAIGQLEDAVVVSQTVTSNRVGKNEAIRELIDDSPALSVAYLLLQLAISSETSNQADFLQARTDLLYRFDNQSNEKEFVLSQLELKRLELVWYGRHGTKQQLEGTVNEVIGLIESVRKQISIQHLGPAWSAKSNQVLDHYVSAVSKLASGSSDNDLWQDLFLFLEQNQAVSYRESRAVPSTSLPDKANDSGLSTLELDVAIAKEVDEQKFAKQALTESQFTTIDYSRDLIASSKLKVLSIAEIQAKLEYGEVIARYYVRGQIGFVYFITNETWFAKTLDEPEQLIPLVKAFQLGIRSQSRSQLRDSRALFDYLHLNELDRNISDTLIIVADGVIEALALGALNAADMNDRYRPVERDFAIFRTHSLSDYFSHNEILNAHKHSNDIAVFADPQFSFDSDLDIDSNNGLRSWSTSLARLPWTAKEAESIEGLFPERKTKIVVGADATAEVLLSSDMLQSRVLHIASHGYFSGNTPELVGIATAPKNSLDPTRVGFVTLDQILTKRISSNLVVISGCETALGQSFSGEGLNGLTRGMLSRGAGSVIGTLWPIPDRPTARFMEYFYRNLKSLNGNVAFALSQTRKDFMMAGPYNNPYFWASFVLYSSDREGAKQVLN